MSLTRWNSTSRWGTVGTVAVYWRGFVCTTRRSHDFRKSRVGSAIAPLLGSAIVTRVSDMGNFLNQSGKITQGMGQLGLGAHITHRKLLSFALCRPNDDHVGRVPLIGQGQRLR